MLFGLFKKKRYKIYHKATINSLLAPSKPSLEYEIEVSSPKEAIPVMLALADYDMLLDEIFGQRVITENEQKLYVIVGNTKKEWKSISGDTIRDIINKKIWGKVKWEG